MIHNINLMDYFREVANSYKFQVSAAVSFGLALFLLWMYDAGPIKILFTVLFVFPFSMLMITLLEKIFFSIYKWKKELYDWSNLTPEEEEFVSYYISQNTKTRYVTAYNGTWTDSGIINPLIRKNILYLASNESEFRGDSWMSAEQQFPFNMHDRAFSFFKKKG